MPRKHEGELDYGEIAKGQKQVATDHRSAGDPVMSPLGLTEHVEAAQAARDWEGYHSSLKKNMNTSRNFSLRKVFKICILKMCK